MLFVYIYIYIPVLAFLVLPPYSLSISLPVTWLVRVLIYLSLLLLGLCTSIPSPFAPKTSVPCQGLRTGRTLARSQRRTEPTDGRYAVLCNPSCMEHLTLGLLSQALRSDCVAAVKAGSSHPSLTTCGLRMIWDAKFGNFLI